MEQDHDAGEFVAADPLGADAESHGRHEAPDGAPLDPLIDLSGDRHPGEANHARPDGD